MITKTAKGSPARGSTAPTIQEPWRMALEFALKRARDIHDELTFAAEELSDELENITANGVPTVPLEGDDSLVYAIERAKRASSPPEAPEPID